jgi:NifU-like protein involved in Fe-S cluster formation
MAAESKLTPSQQRQVTGHGGNPPGQGPFIDVTLVVFRDIVIEARYETYQCPGCQACGQAIVGLVTGKSLADARAIRHEDVVQRVGPLAKHRQICYGLAVLALDDALNHLKGEGSARKDARKEFRE